MKEFYHISLNPNLPAVLEPRIPTELIEDSKEYNLGKRVSFAPTVRQCAIALFYNIPKEDRLTKEITFYIYKLDSKKPLKEISRKKLALYVFDIAVTDEVSFTEPCPIKKIGKMLVRYDINKPIYIKAYNYEGGDVLAGYEPTIQIQEFYTNDMINIESVQAEEY